MVLVPQVYNIKICGVYSNGKFSFPFGFIPQDKMKLIINDADGKYKNYIYDICLYSKDKIVVEYIGETVAIIRRLCEHFDKQTKNTKEHSSITFHSMIDYYLKLVRKEEVWFNIKIKIYYYNSNPDEKLRKEKENELFSLRLSQACDIIISGGILAASNSKFYLISDKVYLIDKKLEILHSEEKKNARK